MSKRKSRKRTGSQKALWLMSFFLASSMIISLIVVALPGAPNPTPTPLPTVTRVVLPSPSPSLTPPASPRPTLSPTLEATEPIMGPVVPTETPTITPTITITPSQGRLPFTFAACGDSRDDLRTYGQALEGVRADGCTLLIHTGDLVNEGTEAVWQAFVEFMAEEEVSAAFAGPIHAYAQEERDGVRYAITG